MKKKSHPNANVSCIDIDIRVLNKATQKGRMWFEITPAEQGTIARLSISYLPPKQWLYKILSFLFANLYCNWCLNNMLNDTKKALEKALTG